MYHCCVLVLIFQYGLVSTTFVEGNNNNFEPAMKNWVTQSGDVKWVRWRISLKWRFRIWNGTNPLIELFYIHFSRTLWLVKYFFDICIYIYNPPGWIRLTRRDATLIPTKLPASFSVMKALSDLNWLAFLDFKDFLSMFWTGLGFAWFCCLGLIQAIPPTQDVSQVCSFEVIRPLCFFLLRTV